MMIDWKTNSFNLSCVIESIRQRAVVEMSVKGPGSEVVFTILLFMFLKQDRKEKFCS